ncbi:hypothetical protein [Alkalicoccus chagannorensis]|uniref:hypothetical protein n=1 Tax=Alkalicoccus chagannorensis TaxID=427072 RepID=UPI0004797927|nr:hypothetical protein [Alkalicoccus chagannorensis]
MKKAALLSTVAGSALLLAACGGENNEMNNEEAGNPADNNGVENEENNDNNSDNNEEADENNENADEEENGEEAAGDVEDLAADYDLDVTVEEDGGDAPEASMEELEEVFALVSTAQEADMLAFVESPQEGEAEESGSVEAHYEVPGVELEEVEAHLVLEFDYEFGGDLGDDDVHPSFEDLSSEEASLEGPEFLTWETDALEADTAGAGTIAEFTGEGAWVLEAEHDGVHVTFEEEDEWLAEFASDILAGIEEE